jgi:hypothetical protein
MPGRIELKPAGYAERSCLLVQYWLPGLPHCYVLCHQQSSNGMSVRERADLLHFFLVEAERLATAATNDPECFLFFHSGAAVRKREGFHVHVYVVQSRWQKALAYTILGSKNFLLACWLSIRRLFSPALAPNPSVKGTSRRRAAPYVER